ncbi:MAG: hypothetical protein AB1445_12280 [Bacillota bacterium]
MSEVVNLTLRLTGTIASRARVPAGERVAVEMGTSIRQVLEQVGLRPEPSWVIVLDGRTSALGERVTSNGELHVFVRVAGG